MIHLLDANMLIALGDADHIHAEAAIQFFETDAVRDGWATCPLTQNAFLQILGNPNYPHGPGSPEEARRILKGLLAAPGHRFWPDEISLSDETLAPSLPPPSQLTDCYLLALAVRKNGNLVTFDRGIQASSVKGGKKALKILRA